MILSNNLHKKINFNKNVCIFLLSNTNNLLLNHYLKKKTKDFKIIKNKKKSRSLNPDFNNSFLMIISLSLVKQKYLDLFSQTDFLKKIKIFGVLYNNCLWELDKFLFYLKSGLSKLSNTLIINKIFSFHKISIIKLILILNKIFLSL